MEEYVLRKKKDCLLQNSSLNAITAKDKQKLKKLRAEQDARISEYFLEKVKAGEKKGNTWFTLKSLVHEDEWAKLPLLCLIKRYEENSSEQEHRKSALHAGYLLFTIAQKLNYKGTYYQSVYDKDVKVRKYIKD